MLLNRRKLITGLISLVAAPAIVRVSSLMPVKTMLPSWSSFSPWLEVPILPYELYDFMNGIQWSLHQIDQITGIRTIKHLKNEKVYIHDDGRVEIKC